MGACEQRGHAPAKTLPEAEGLLVVGGSRMSGNCAKLMTGVDGLCGKTGFSASITI